MARDPLSFLARVQREHGDVACFDIVDHRVVLFSHPDALEEILVRQWRSMHKDAIYDLMRPFLGNGLVTAEGEDWKRHRQLAAPAFRPKQVATYGEVMVARTRDFLDTLSDGEVRDIHEDMMELAQHIVLETVFGSDLTLDTREVGRAIEICMEGFSYEAHHKGRLLPKWVPTRTRRRVAGALDRLDETVAGLIAARREAGLGDDVLSRLLEARDDEGQGLSDAQIRDEVVTLFTAGHETTALALTYTLGFLSEHPEVADRLAAEVDEVLGDRAAGSGDRARLPYTEAVFTESMRLLPPVWAIGREAQEDVEICGTHVPKGVQLLVSQWVVHHDARWFPEPERFWPERWLDEDWRSALPRLAYFPFGGGPRVCIGNHFAMLEGVLILATLAQRVRLQGIDPFPPPRMASITMRPKGPVRFRVNLRR